MISIEWLLISQDKLIGEMQVGKKHSTNVLDDHVNMVYGGDRCG